MPQRTLNYNHTRQALQLQGAVRSAHTNNLISTQLTQSHTSDGHDQLYNYNNIPKFITIKHLIVKFISTKTTTMHIHYHFHFSNFHIQGPILQHCKLSFSLHEISHSKAHFYFRVPTGKKIIAQPCQWVSNRDRRCTCRASLTNLTHEYYTNDCSRLPSLPAHAENCFFAQVHEPQFAGNRALPPCSRRNRHWQHVAVSLLNGRQWGCGGGVWGG